MKWSLQTCFTLEDTRTQSFHKVKSLSETLSENKL